MWEFKQTDELYHYGVPGMRWGHRKSVRYAYKEYNSAKRGVTKAHLSSMGRWFNKSQYAAGSANNAKRALLNKKVNDARSKREKAAFKLIDAKAKEAYDKKLAKTGSKVKAEKASIKVHTKAFNKDKYGSGRVGSVADSQYRHGSNYGNTRYYKHLVKTKGKQYANKVEKKYNNITTRELVGSAAIVTGLAITSAYLNRKYS